MVSSAGAQALLSFSSDFLEVATNIYRYSMLSKEKMLIDDYNNYDKQVINELNRILRNDKQGFKIIEESQDNLEKSTNIQQLKETIKLISKSIGRVDKNYNQFLHYKNLYNKGIFNNVLNDFACQVTSCTDRRNYSLKIDLDVLFDDFSNEKDEFLDLILQKMQV